MTQEWRKFTEIFVGIVEMNPKSAPTADDTVTKEMRETWTQRK